MGYYLNAGSDETKPIIACDKTKCEAIPPESSCAVGKVIKEGTSLKLCISATVKQEIAIDAEGNGTPIYETLTVGPNAFPGIDVETGKTEKIAVKFKTDGSVLFLESASLPKCIDSPVSQDSKCKINNDEVTDYCILDTKIYKSDTNSCALLADTDGTILLFNDDSSIADVTKDPNPDTPTMAYKCTFDDNSGLDKCELVKGYIQIDGTPYQCNGWKGEICEQVTLSNCNDNTKGLLGNFDSKPSICFGASFGVTLPNGTEDTPSLLAFSIQTTSSEYGMMAGDVITLSLTSKEALVTTLDEGKHYIIIIFFIIYLLYVNKKKIGIYIILKKQH